MAQSPLKVALSGLFRPRKGPWIMTSNLSHVCAVSLLWPSFCPSPRADKLAQILTLNHLYKNVKSQGASIQQTFFCVFFVRPRENRELSGPLSRLVATLSLLHPLDRYRTHICDRECDWVALFRIPTHSCRSSQLPCSRPPRSSTVRLWCYRVQNPFKNKRKTKLDEGRDSQPCPRP